MSLDSDDQKFSWENQVILYRNENERLEQRQERIDKQSKEVGIKNIEELRKFWLHLTSISAAFIGFIIPVLAKGEGNIFKTINLTWIAVKFHLIVNNSLGCLRNNFCSLINQSIVA